MAGGPRIIPQVPCPHGLPLGPRQARHAPTPHRPSRLPADGAGAGLRSPQCHPKLTYTCPSESSPAPVDLDAAVKGSLIHLLWLNEAEPRPGAGAGAGSCF